MRHAEIGKRIKQRRMEMDMSAAELASRLSMSRATIHRYENGDIAKIKLPVIDSIARELNVNPGWLLGKSEDKDCNSGRATPASIENVICEVIGYVKSDSDIRCCGKPVTRSDRLNMASMFEAIANLMVDKYSR